MAGQSANDRQPVCDSGPEQAFYWGPSRALLVVESKLVDNERGRPSDGPIGVVASLVTGFDRMAARPILILPPLLLDTFLWLGPKLNVGPWMQRLAAQLVAPTSAEQAVQQQVAALRDTLQMMAERFNLLTALSSLPTGIPSLMAGVMPEQAPVDWFGQLQLADPSTVLLGWIALSAIGIGFGVVYHRALAQTVAPEAELPSGIWAWGRMLLLALLAYLGLLVAGTLALLVATVAAFLLPLLGIGVSFIAFTLIFWLVVYLIFTPHGIVRYRFGVIRAMLESAFVVRWNFLSTVGFLSAAALISWLTNQIWALPTSSSWFELLSMVGHAFVSGTLLASSYVYYQGRREHLVRTREHLEARLAALERAQALTQHEAEEEGEQ